MRKFLALGLALAILLITLLPVPVSAQPTDCCQYSIDTCCREMCCAEVTYWFKVSYFERVWLPEIQMWSHTWVSQYIEAHDSKVAAELLGLEAGYNCFVVRAISYHGEP